MKLEITRQWLVDTLARGGPDDVSAGFSSTMATAPAQAPVTVESVMRAMDEILPWLKAGTEKLGAASVAAAASMRAFSNVLQDFDRADGYKPRFDVLYGLGTVGVPSMIRDTFLDVKVVQNALATERVRRRTHKHRRGQTLAYHRRVQKKWDKRFGFDQRPCAYRLADGSLVVHPTIYEAMRREI